MNRLRFYHNGKWMNGFYICDSTLDDELIWVEDEREEVYLVNKENVEPLMQELAATLGLLVRS